LKLENDLFRNTKDRRMEIHFFHLEFSWLTSSPFRVVQLSEYFIGSVTAELKLCLPHCPEPDYGICPIILLLTGWLSGPM
jgi:hypothetical protein